MVKPDMNKAVNAKAKDNANINDTDFASVCPPGNLRSDPRLWDPILRPDRMLGKQRAPRTHSASLSALAFVRAPVHVKMHHAGP